MVNVLNMNTILCEYLISSKNEEILKLDDWQVSFYSTVYRDNQVHSL